MLFIAIYGSNSQAQGNQFLVTKALEQAQEQLDSLDLKQALTISESIITTYTNVVDTQLFKAYSIKGDALHGLGKYDAAIEQYEEAKKIALQFTKKNQRFLAQANNDLGLCFWQKKKTALAEQYFRDALQLRIQLFGNQHPKVADSYNNLGNCSFERRDLSTARDYYEQALNIRINTLPSDNLDIASSYNNLGSCYRLANRFEKAIDYYSLSLKIRKSKLGNQHPKVAQSYTNLGLCYEQMGTLEAAIDYYNQSIQIYSVNGMEQHPNIVTNYLGLGGCYSKFGNHQEAVSFFEKALFVQRTSFGEESPNLITVYNNLANAYKKLGDYKQAMLLYENNVYLLNNTFGKQHPFTAATYNNIGLIHVELSHYEEALTYYRLALTIYENLQDFHRLANTWNNIGTCLRQQKKYAEAIIAYQQSSSIFEQLFGKNASYNAKVYYNIGNCLAEGNRFEEAIRFYDKAKDIGINGNNQLAAHAKSIGVIYQKQGKLDEALVQFENALQYLQNNESTSSSYLSIGVHSPIDVIDILNLKAKTLYEKYNTQQSTHLLQKAIVASDSSLNIIAVLKKQYQEESSKRKLNELAYETYEVGVAAAHLLYSETKDNRYLEKAFHYSERSKGNIVLEEQLSQKVALSSDIPDSLLEKEKHFKTIIGYYEKQKHNAAPNDSNYINEINNILFQQKQDYQQLIQQFQQDYPAYLQAKYEDVTISTKTLQEQLAPEEAVLEYFVSDSTIYIFFITPQKTTLTSVIVDSLEQEVTLLREGITRYYMDIDTQTEEGYRFLLIQYLRVANFLYRKLVQPFENDLPKRLIIINSKILHYIPFDALVTSLPENTLHRLRDIRYLIKDYEINYANSATLLHTIRKKKNPVKPANKILGIAPKFTFPNNLGLAPLNFNTKEVRQIQSLFPDSKTFMGIEATKSNFVANADAYQILHLATHAKADVISGDYSFLAFANEHADYNEDDLLYAKDIYNLRLNADMVILSACETGSGELLRGEGVVSLARAFIYSGAKSIITTLWSINDATTQGIITSFYRELDKGIPTGEALRKAKLQYIEEADDPNPFFWAAFTLTGEYQVLPTQPSNTNKILLVIMLVSIALAFIYLFFYVKGGKKQ